MGRTRGDKMVRPIDVFLPVQRGPEMNQNMRGEQRTDMQQQHFAERIAKETHEQERQVQGANKGEESALNADGRGGSAYGRRKKDKKKEKQEESKKQQAASMSMLDIKC